MTGLSAHIEVRRGDFELGIELGVGRGETVAVLGPNGAGKSTLVRALAGLTPLHDGRIELDGQVLDEPSTSTFVTPDERRIGVAFQDPLLFPHLDVLGNVGFGVSKAARTQAATRALSRVGLAGFERRGVGELSGGEARRVSIARALAVAPGLLILDEPFAGVDSEARHDLRVALADSTRDFDGACLVITHDLAEARALADTMVVIEHGALVQTGAANDLHLRPATNYVAALVGANVFDGIAEQGRVRVTASAKSQADGQQSVELTVADHGLSGPVRVRVDPAAVALHREGFERGGASPRNAWRARVGAVHRIGDVVRVHLDDPIPLVADVTVGAVAELGIEVGVSLWVAIKATSLQQA